MPAKKEYFPPMQQEYFPPVQQEALPSPPGRHLFHPSQRRSCLQNLRTWVLKGSKSKGENFIYFVHRDKRICSSGFLRDPVTLYFLITFYPIWKVKKVQRKRGELAPIAPLYALLQSWSLCIGTFALKEQSSSWSSVIICAASKFFSTFKRVVESGPPFSEVLPQPVTRPCQSTYMIIKLIFSSMIWLVKIQ